LNLNLQFVKWFDIEIVLVLHLGPAGYPPPSAGTRWSTNSLPTTGQQHRRSPFESGKNPDWEGESLLAWKGPGSQTEI